MAAGTGHVQPDREPRDRRREPSGHIRIPRRHGRRTAVTISSINALVEALKGNMPISRVWISQSKTGGKIDEIKRLCRQNRIVFQFVPSDAITRRAGSMVTTQPLTISKSTVS
jgi:tRNA G18 (ribose-2'-O)-methylase SpoU